MSVSECVGLLSFDYAQINVTIQQRSADIFPSRHPSAVYTRLSQFKHSAWSKTLRPAANQSDNVPWQQREERGRWSWQIRIYVVTAVRCHSWAHYVHVFMKWWACNCRTTSLWACVCVCPFESERKLKQNKWFEMVINISLLLVSTAQSFLRRAADSVSGVVDDGRREQKPTWAAPNCTAGTDAHTHTSTHTHSFMRLELLRTNGGWGKMSNKWPGTELNSGHWNN